MVLVSSLDSLSVITYSLSVIAYGLSIVAYGLSINAYSLNVVAHSLNINQPRPKKKTSQTHPKRSGDNKNAILWTPLLTPFAQTDMLGPKGLGFLLYGRRVERNLKGHIKDGLSTV